MFCRHVGFNGVLSPSRNASSAASPPVDTHWLLEYVYDAADEAELEARRSPVRPQHLDYARAAVARRHLALGGAAFASSAAARKGEGGAAHPPIAGLLVFRGCTRGDVEAFARGDPYVAQPTNTGRPLVTAFSVREWRVVLKAEPPPSAPPSAPLKG